MKLFSMREKQSEKNRYKKKAASLFVCAAVMMTSLTALTACGGRDIVIEGESKTFTDSCGRTVEMSADIERIAPSGAVAQMILATIAPDLMVGLSATPSSTQYKYFPEYFLDLPTFGQFYGSKATLNMESMIAADPQVTIDLGDKKEGHASDMNTIQKQTGVPTVFIESDLEHMAQAYRSLGELLGREERGEELAQFVDKTMNMAAENAAKIPEEDRVSVMYATGTAGLACNADGSIQSVVIDIVGADNAVVVSEDELSNAGGGNTISMEQVYMFDPDVIIFAAGGPFDTISGSGAGEWSELSAIKQGKYYEIPCEPYNWMSGPPSVNSVLGVWWLGNLIYPDIYNYDMKEITKEYYSLFFNYELTDEEVEAFLQKSTLKALS